jgi:hypothetical protein
VVKVADLPDGRAAVLVHLADFAAGHLDRHPGVVHLARKNALAAGAARKLATFAGLQLNAVNRQALRDGVQRRDGKTSVVWMVDRSFCNLKLQKQQGNKW